MQIACFGQETDARRIRSIGLMASAVQLLLAAALGWVASGGSDFPNPPEVVPRGLAIGILYVVPGVIGVIGAIGERRSVLGGAAAASAIGSALAFSGVTVVFLIPALLFAAAAGANEARPSMRPTRHFWRLIVFALLAIPVVVLGVLTLGIFVVPAIVLMVLVVEVARGAARASLGEQLVGLGVSAIIAGLLVGSGWLLFSMTETRCWTAYQTPGGIEYRTVPELEGVIQSGEGHVGSGCDSGELTPRGAALAAVLAGGAIGVAVLAAADQAQRRRRPRTIAR